MGYNWSESEPDGAGSRRSSRRIKDFALFAALPIGLGAVAAGVTLALPGAPDDSLRDAFDSAYINGVASITVAGVLQVWFTMGETRRANEERTRADWERARADEARARAEEERRRTEEERARAAEERQRANEAEARATAQAQARAETLAAAANEMQRQRLDLELERTRLEMQRVEQAERANAELLRVMRSLTDSVDLLRRQLDERANGHSQL